MSRLEVEGLVLKPSDLIVRAFDGSKRSVFGEVELPIQIGSQTFNTVFYVMDISPSYSCLLVLMLTHLSLPYGLHILYIEIICCLLTVVCLSEYYTDLFSVSTGDWYKSIDWHPVSIFFVLGDWYKSIDWHPPDLKELRNLTYYVLNPLGFKARYGKLLPLLTTQVDEGLMSTLAQFYDPLYHCFSFSDFQLLPTLEEYAHLVGIPILDQVPFSGLESIPTSREIADLLHIDESLIEAHMTTKGGIQGLPSDFLVAQATVYRKAMSEDAFEAIFVLLIYGLVLFPNIDKFVDVNAIRIFSVLNPVPTLLGDAYFSLHLRNAKGGGAIVCCLPLLYKWFISHLPQTVAFKENKGCLRWSTRLMSLTNDDISWYDRVYDTVQIIDYCGEFPNVPLLGTCGGISYNPILARRQLGFPLKDKPHNILLEGMFFQEGKDPQGLKARMVRAWRKIHKKGRSELGPKNCIALEPYTSWVRQRASEYLMPYDYPRPTPLVVVGPSTLSNQGIEELRDEDLSRAWIREREELLQQLKEKDALIEFLEHQVIDDPNDTWTSLLPQSSKFWKRKYDRLAKKKADMEATYEREIKRLCVSRLPASRASRDP
ncbi:hypothetical protein KIW84_013958 [Lathyrus oleraceus]|uniref:DUF7745 domain-containing protein n=1 Tax=Pisum sativum TaxID=3888 RepID=A0A9D5GYQ0_PEA|nr:hypothetical protein KIW84_013958 [Pisum sativum]